MFHRSQGTDMTKGSIPRHLLSFAAPMAAGLLFQQLYNTVDSVVVGWYVGKEALAAVGSVSSIINMLVGLCAGLSIGAGVVISQRYGAHEGERLSKAVQTTVVATLILCVLATGIGILIAPAMLRFTRTTEEVFPLSLEYLTIYFAGISGLLLYNVGSGILRAVGDSLRPLIFLCVSAALNIAGDLLFVVVFRMGVAGVAYATVLAQFISAALVLITLTRTKADYGIRWRKLAVERDALSHIFSVGMPAGVQQAVTSFSNVFVQSYINAFGTDFMAGWAGYNKLDAFILVPVQAIAMASTTFVGQNYGAKNLSRARQGVRQAMIGSVAITAALSGIAILFASKLMRLFAQDPNVIGYGVQLTAIISPFYITICFNQIFAGALRGVGNARTPMIIMLTSFVAFRQLYLLVSSRLGGGLIAVALAYPMGWVMCSSLMLIFYRKSALCRQGEPLA